MPVASRRPRFGHSSVEGRLGRLFAPSVLALIVVVSGTHGLGRADAGVAFFISQGRVLAQSVWRRPTAPKSLLGPSPLQRTTRPGELPRQGASLGNVRTSIPDRHQPSDFVPLVLILGSRLLWRFMRGDVEGFRSCSFLALGLCGASRVEM